MNRGKTMGYATAFAKQDLTKHKDQYRVMAVSTAHLSAHARRIMANLAFSSNMVTQRATGFFIKLYEFEGYDPSDKAVWQDMYPGITDAMVTLLMAAYLAGFRMVEFDSDAHVLGDFDVFDVE